MATQKTDVVIVGVGATGGILAAELAKAGMQVIGLERGPRHATSDFLGLDELRYFQRQDLRPNPKTQPVTWRPNTNTQAVRLAPLNFGNQAGGGTVHYGAVSWRFHESDFRVRSQTIERYGAAAIPEDCSVTDWPLSYADLEPYYDRAEYDLGVSGQAGNLQGRKNRGRQHLRGAAAARIPAAAARGRLFGPHLRGRRQEARLSPVLDAACDPLETLPGAAGLQLLRLLLDPWLLHRRQVVDPGHEDSARPRPPATSSLSPAPCAIG